MARVGMLGKDSRVLIVELLGGSISLCCDKMNRGWQVIIVDGCSEWVFIKS